MIFTMKVIHKVKKKDEATDVSMTSFALALESPSPEPPIPGVNEGFQTLGTAMCAGTPRLKPITTAKQKPTQSTCLTGALLYPFQIKDQWLELENKTNRKVLTKGQCFHYVVLIQRDAI